MILIFNLIEQLIIKQSLLINASLSFKAALTTILSPSFLFIFLLLNLASMQCLFCQTNIIYMVQCQFSVLLEINLKIQNIMRCLDLYHNGTKEIIRQENIVQVIIQNLSKTLQRLLQKDQHQQYMQDEAGRMYENMQRQLQRQQNLNRSLIKKELEFKEYQKCLIDELTEERKSVKELQNQIIKNNDRILAKDLEILQLNNQKRMVSKDTAKDKKNKELFMFQTLVNEKKLIDPFKVAVKDTPIATHQRRKSDELTKRPSTGTSKKKGSITKK